MLIRSPVLLCLLVLGASSVNAAEYLLSDQAKSLNLPFSEGPDFLSAAQQARLPGGNAASFLTSF